MTTPPVPTNFPIPPDLEGFWTWEKGHFPRPATPLTHERLLNTLDEMLQDFRERWTIHGYINFVVISASWFADFYNETFEPEDPLEAYLLLQGFPTRSLDAGRGLWRLSRIIKQSPALKRLFEEQEPAQLVSHLERSDEGRNFLQEFRAYLDEFGWRSEAFELADTTWRENPTIPLNTLQGYISLDQDANPDVRFYEAVQTREKLVGQARERLIGDPDKLARFNELYDIGRHNLVLT